MTTASLPFDARALTEPVDPSAARAFAQQLRQNGRVPGAFTGSTVVFVVIVGVFVLMFG